MREPDRAPQKSSFLTTLPGLIAALAALLTAVGGLVSVYYSQKPRGQAAAPIVEGVAPKETLAPQSNPKPAPPIPKSKTRVKPATPITGAKQDQETQSLHVSPPAQVPKEMSSPPESPLKEGKYELQG